MHQQKEKILEDLHLRRIFISPKQKEKKNQKVNVKKTKKKKKKKME